MSVVKDARERARSEVVSAIKATASQHLAASGASALSLRAVARDLGLVSSALYRYFPSRDALLTALIVDAYDAVGAAAEQADATAVAAGATREPAGWRSAGPSAPGRSTRRTSTRSSTAHRCPATAPPATPSSPRCGSAA